MLAPRHRFPREKTMARSHQRGTVRPEHKSWIGYLNLKVLDPITGESKWKKQRVGVLGFCLCGINRGHNIGWSRRKFGTLWYGRDFGWLASDRINSSGRLTQR